jgi:hypothetical protein
MIESMTRLAVIAAALMLAVGCAGGGHPVAKVRARPKAGRSLAAGRRHHYFVVGKRECQRQLRYQHGLDSLVFVRTGPARYAKDLQAGCRAAAGL